MTETFRLADQIRRAFEGNAWHGDSLLELLAGVNAKTAAAKPIKDAHSIWELLLHVEVWDNAALVRLTGKVWEPEGDKNFPPVTNPTPAEWRKAVDSAKRTHDTLVKTAEKLSDARLQDRVPGKNYNFSHMFHGIAQHELYHAGQIAILKKAVLK